MILSRTILRCHYFNHLTIRGGYVKYIEYVPPKIHAIIVVSAYFESLLLMPSDCYSNHYDHGNLCWWFIIIIIIMMFVDNGDRQSLISPLLPQYQYYKRYYHNNHHHRYHHYYHFKYHAYHCPSISLHACSPRAVGGIHEHLLVGEAWIACQPSWC